MQASVSAHGTSGDSSSPARRQRITSWACSVYPPPGNWVISTSGSVPRSEPRWMRTSSGLMKLSISIQPDVP